MAANGEGRTVHAVRLASIMQHIHACEGVEGESGGRSVDVRLGALTLVEEVEVVKGKGGHERG